MMHRSQDQSRPRHTDFIRQAPGWSRQDSVRDYRTLAYQLRQEPRRNHMPTISTYLVVFVCLGPRCQETAYSRDRGRPRRQRHCPPRRDGAQGRRRMGGALASMGSKPWHSFPHDNPYTRAAQARHSVCQPSRYISGCHHGNASSPELSISLDRLDMRCARRRRRLQQGSKAHGAGLQWRILCPRKQSCQTPTGWLPEATRAQRLCGPGGTRNRCTILHLRDCRRL